MPAPVMWPSAYENMYGRPSNLLPADRRKEPAVCWVIVRWLVSMNTYIMCIYDPACVCLVLVLWLIITAHVIACVPCKQSWFLQISRKQTVWALISKSICAKTKKKKKKSTITRQPGGKVGLVRCLCSSTICFCICACVCGNLPVRLWSRVCAAHILYKPVQLS